MDVEYATQRLVGALAFLGLDNSDKGGAGPAASQPFQHRD